MNIVTLKAGRIVNLLAADMSKIQFVAFNYDQQSKKTLRDCIDAGTTRINLDDGLTGLYTSSLNLVVEDVNAPNEDNFMWDDVLIVSCTIVKST